MLRIRTHRAPLTECTAQLLTLWSTRALAQAYRHDRLSPVPVAEAHISASSVLYTTFASASYSMSYMT